MGFVLVFKVAASRHHPFTHTKKEEERLIALKLNKRNEKKKKIHQVFYKFQKMNKNSIFL
jgi:hypothetical protein